MGQETSVVTDLANAVSRETVIRHNEPLARRTTLRVGGPADFYIEPANEEDLATVLRFCNSRAIPFFVMGRGSNLIVRDGGFRGVVICLASPNFSRVEVTGHRLFCGAGAKLKVVAVEACRHKLSGLEFLAGIPGSVGGALRMNAGAMGSWMFNVVESFRYMDSSGEVHEDGSPEATYRECPLLRNHIALSAVLKGYPATCSEIERRMEAFSRKRWVSQPAEPSAGCIFKNPAMVPAGKLIEDLGLKGARVGGAIVSEKHANFITTDHTAKAADVLKLIELIQQRARTDRGIELEPEVQVIGED